MSGDWLWDRAHSQESRSGLEEEDSGNPTLSWRGRWTIKVEVCRRHLSMWGVGFKGGKDLATR